MTATTYLAFLVCVGSAVVWAFVSTTKDNNIYGRLLYTLISAVCVFYAGMYFLVIIGRVDSQTIGMLYLRPALIVLMSLLIALAVKHLRNR